jgi:hypothetical protein
MRTVVVLLALAVLAAGCGIGSSTKDRLMDERDGGSATVATATQPVKPAQTVVPQTEPQTQSTGNGQATPPLITLPPRQIVEAGLTYYGQPGQTTTAWSTDPVGQYGGIDRPSLPRSTDPKHAGDLCVPRFGNGRQPDLNPFYLAIPGHYEDPIRAKWYKVTSASEPDRFVYAQVADTTEEAYLVSPAVMCALTSTPGRGNLQVVLTDETPPGGTFNGWEGVPA